MPPPLAAVIMAAGQGKRMQDPSKPKVLYLLAGKPLLGHVLDLCNQLGCSKVIAVIGHEREQVRAYLDSTYPTTETAIQAEQLGTGHAVMQAESLLQGFKGDVLVLSGDVPLLTAETVGNMLSEHRKTGAKATVLTVDMPDPKGYGRIVRDANSANLVRIVEEKDADEATKSIREINSGIYAFEAASLFPALHSLTRDNAQGEYYLTDVLEAILRTHGPSATRLYTTADVAEVSGVNTKEQLLALESELLSRSVKPSTLG